MNEAVVLHLAQEGMTVAFMISAPILAVAMVVGLAVSIFQAVTQIQEMTLTFVPKIVGVSLVVLLAGPWMLGTMTTYTANLLTSLPAFAK